MKPKPAKASEQIDWIPEQLKARNAKWMKKIADLRNAAGGMLRGQSARSLVFVARTFCPKLRASERSPASDFIVFVEKQNRGEVAILNRIRAAERSRLLFGLELAATVANRCRTLGSTACLAK